MVVNSEPDALRMDASIPVVPTPAIAVATQAPEVQEDRLDTAVITEAESDLPSHEIKAEGSSSIKEGEHDAVQNSSHETFDIVKADSGIAAVNILPEALPSTTVDGTNGLLTSTSSSAVAGEFVGEIPVVTNVISEKSVVSAPLNEESHLKQFEASAELQDSHAIVIDDTQNVILSHESVSERHDISESSAEEGTLTDNASVNTAIPASLGESVDPNFEHIASADISKPESELPLGVGDFPPVDNPNNISITTVELEAGPTHVDKMSLEVVKDKDDVAADPSIILVDPSEISTNHGGVSETIEHIYPLGSTLDAHIDTEPIDLNWLQVPSDVSDVNDERERSAKESHLEVVNSAQSDPIMVRIKSGVRLANTENL